MLMLQEKASKTKFPFSESISAENFRSNSNMLQTSTIRYVESFASYCSHIERYLNCDFNLNESKLILFFYVRITDFLKDAPHEIVFQSKISRYERLHKRFRSFLEIIPNLDEVIKSTPGLYEELSKDDYNDLKKGTSHE